MTTPIKLYRYPLSGHSHRVELMLALLDLTYEAIDVDLANGAHKAPDFLKLSPFGKVPAIDDNGFTLSDSNAILVYLVQTYAPTSNWLPSDPKQAAEVQRWLTIAADQIFSGPCAARLVTLFGAPIDHQGAISKAHALFEIMNAHLSDREWLASDSISIADVAGYSYIAHAPEGGVSLDAYSHIRSWLDRIEQQPHFVAMAASPLPKLA
ncbi:glutathione S-transferase family protein [Cohaesibacter intestini]|uniref:glutathione S-transferase family protein n=1 Tax=Cohaesibacter intestini TaxID=2211145 RepID=UPI000DEA1881|nr:glutathione S-transferase [Cohaesibacter intestini]